MGVAASLQQPSLRVDPGATTTCTLRLRNTGTVVDRLDITVLAAAAPWATVAPASVSLLLGDEGMVSVTFAPLAK
jgi:hypothetical protein